MCANVKHTRLDMVGLLRPLEHAHGLDGCSKKTALRNKGKSTCFAASVQPPVASAGDKHSPLLSLNIVNSRCTAAALAQQTQWRWPVGNGSYRSQLQRQTKGCGARRAPSRQTTAWRATFPGLCRPWRLSNICCKCSSGRSQHLHRRLSVVHELACNRTSNGYRAVSSTCMGLPH